MENETRTAVVQKVVSGKHGPYVVAQSEDLGTITFSLDESVWNEVRLPEKGNFVVLSEITKKRAGWRASHGRFFRPSDQKTENRTEKK